MKALIDADSLLYKVGFAIEDKTMWNEFDVEAGLEPELDVSFSTDLQQLYTTFDQMFENIMFATECDDHLLVFSGGDNFRLDSPIGYKENRKDSRKPLGYSDLLFYIRSSYNTYTTKGIEADDYVVFHKTYGDEDYVVCAIDKDVLYQTAGTHYNYNTDEEITVTPWEATKYAYIQTLTGDSSDGYKGCKGVGVKRAEKLLDGLETEAALWKAVVDAYEKAGQTEAEAVETMRLANMHQWDGKKVILWNPPKID